MKTPQGAPAEPEDPTQEQEQLEQPDTGEQEQAPAPAEPTDAADPAEPEATPQDPPDASAAEPAAGGEQESQEKQPAKPAAAKPTKPVDLVEAAKARLIGGKPEATAKPGDAKPAPKPGTQPQQAQGQPPQAPKTELNPGDPVATWTPAERQHTKGTVKDRFRQLHRELEETRPVAELGRAWDGLIREEKLVDAVQAIGDEGVAWGIRANHASLRAAQALQAGRAPDPADLAIVDQVRKGLDAIDQAMGRSRAPSALEPLQGNLPADLQQYVDLGMPEEHARLLAAALAAKGTAAQSQREQQEQARRREAAAAAEKAARGTPRQPAPQQQVRQAPASPWSPADYALQRQQTLADLGQLVRVDVRTKEGQEKAYAFAEQHLGRHIHEILTAAVPDVPFDQAFAQLSPQGRRDLYGKAIERYRAAAQSIPTSAAPRPADRPLRTRPTPPQATAPADPVAVAKARLIGPTTGE